MERGSLVLMRSYPQRQRCAEDRFAAVAVSTVRRHFILPLPLLHSLLFSPSPSFLPPFGFLKIPKTLWIVLPLFPSPHLFCTPLRLPLSIVGSWAGLKKKSISAYLKFTRHLSLADSFATLSLPTQTVRPLKRGGLLLEPYSSAFGFCRTLWISLCLGTFDIVPPRFLSRFKTHRNVCLFLSLTSTPFFLSFALAVVHLGDEKLVGCYCSVVGRLYRE